MNPSDSALQVYLPTAPLRPYVGHYWSSLNNRDDRCAIAPDGAVDVVLVVGPSTFRVEAFGTTTKLSDVPLVVGHHYLGVRFKPGQSRHFLDAKTVELTDTARDVEGALLPDLSRVAESAALDSRFAQLDTALLQHLKHRTPRQSRFDDVIRHVEQMHGAVRVAELATMACKSRRQFERTFLDIVGLPAKLFTEIIRSRRAAEMLAHSNLPLAQVAAVMGYTDQSHFTHECIRFFGKSPSRLKEDAAFLQATGNLARHNSDSLCI